MKKRPVWENRIKTATALLLAGMVMLLAVLFIAMDKKEFSENENRYLAEFPSVSLEKIKSGFIYIEYLSRFLCKCRINLHQSICNIFMHRRFANPKLLRRLPNGSIVINNIISNIDCSFLNIILQKKTPQNTFLHCMKCPEGL